ncbi:Zn-dependent hydrolase [Rhodosalinus sediminis]|uniref:Zn-dependent hydrolase n=1 Tax=Rhodosalinus sediminis TaxID=1940533 RepID=A0A3D9BZK9_9RHOB|nr:MBL fold metallo-hydrolase [Rhodosalinus sediminis]REC58967.1 Zn-dependent hydrolase [Rhodosalinus sediminis]
MIRLLAAALAVCLALPAAAQDAAERRPSHCIAIADAAPGIEYRRASAQTASPPAARLWRASTQPSHREALPDYTVRLRFLGHASFLIRTPGGLTAVTDYTGFIGNTDLIPDVVTMNHAHSTHWTANPDPAIPHVLRGWGEEFGAGIEHHLDLGEMLVRNVSTDIRGGFNGRDEPRGNSIFVFEVAGLCIGHLGHLHHMPTEAQFAALGRLDVVMAPVDGGYTMALDDMIAVLKRLRASVVLPMHWFSGRSLGTFRDGMADDFAIVDRNAPFIDVSLADLPERPTVVFLQPRRLRD